MIYWKEREIDALERSPRQSEQYTKEMISILSNFNLLKYSCSYFNEWVISWLYFSSNAKSKEGYWVNKF